MKKKYFTATVIAAAAIGILTGCGSRADIGRDAAVTAALNDAGVSEQETAALSVSLDEDNGRRVYDIQFNVAEKEYDYEISAADGNILSSNVDINEHYAALNNSQGTADQNAASGQGNAASGQGNTGVSQGNTGAVQRNTAAVTQDQAVQTALARVPGATEQNIRIQLDYDDGVQRYEGDIIYNNMEYDFAIDANTGEVIEWSEERR